MPFRILYVTTRSMPRTRAADLSINITYSKDEGWQLRDSRGVMVAIADRKTRHPDEGLRLDVDGVRHLRLAVPAHMSEQEHIAITPEAHKQRHAELHRAFDELFADFIAHHPKRRSFLDMPVRDLMEWSHAQTQEPTP